MEHKLPEQVETSANPLSTELGALVRRAQSGERQAFDDLLLRFQNMAVGYCAVILGDFQLAEDAAQEAFLETCRILPAIRMPEAFPAYLRLTLRKHCNRLTRRQAVSTVPLDAARNVPATENFGPIAASDERDLEVRAAVRSLPEAERAAILLFYIGERSLKEVAEFLEVPVSTVKNRLHTARRRLRERLLSKMESALQETVQEQRPSRDGNFRGVTIARLYETYRQQFRAEPRTADRALLAQARTELRQAIAEGTRDPETIHAGVRLLVWTDDYAALPDVMDYYLTESLPPDELFWAKWTRIRGLAMRNEATAVADAQRDLTELVREIVAGNLAVRLSAHEPFAPTADLSEAAIAPDAVALFALGITEIGMCYHEAGRFDEWLTMVNETIDSAPKTASNRLQRFFQLRHVIYLLGRYGRETETVAPLDRIRDLSAEESDWQSLRWPIEALYLKMCQFADSKDVTGLTSAAAEATDLLQAFWTRIDAPTKEQTSVLGTLTNNVAAALNSPGTYDLALPLWEQLASLGRLPNDWSYLCYAQSVWETTKDRARTLPLLREAAAFNFDGSLQKTFLDKTPAFADIHEDPEFLAAVAGAVD